MEQIIALIVFAVIAVGGSLLRKYVEKQQREQQAAKHDAKQEAQRQQWQREYGKQGAKPRPQQEGRQQVAQRGPAGPQRRQQPAAVAPPSSRTAPAAGQRQPGRAARHSRPQQAQPPRPAEPAEPAETPTEARQKILQQVRTSAARREVSAAGARLGSLGEAKFPTLATMGPASLGATTAVATGAARRGTGRVDYIGDMLRGRNVARAIVLSEILGPPKGLP